MKKMILSILIFCAVSFSQEKGDSLFIKAILDESTTPYFILVVLKDSLGKTDTVCIEAPFLSGAIHLQYKLDYSESGSKKVDSIILGNNSRTFSITNSKALENVKPRYTKSILAEVHRQLDTLSNAELLRQLKIADNSFLHQIYNRRSFPEYASYRDAVAYILLKRNISVRRGCVAGYLLTD